MSVTMAIKIIWHNPLKLHQRLKFGWAYQQCSMSILKTVWIHFNCLNIYHYIIEWTFIHWYDISTVQMPLFWILQCCCFFYCYHILPLMCLLRIFWIFLANYHTVTEIKRAINLSKYLPWLLGMCLKQILGNIIITCNIIKYIKYCC